MPRSLPAWIAIWLGIFAVLAYAMAHDATHAPEDSDPAMADWFRSLTIPDTNGASCCNEKDCVTLSEQDIKVEDGAYWVKDPEGQDWLQVPVDHILARYDNPTGKYVACVYFHRVLCFVKAGGT